MSVPLDLPVDNQSFSFLIPANTSDYVLNFSTNIPNNSGYYRWVSDVTFRIDGAGIYNIIESVDVSWIDGTGPHMVTLGPGFYDIADLNVALNGLFIINLSGLNAHKAVMIPGVLSAVIPAALQPIIGWPPVVNSILFTPSNVVDIMLNKDLILVYASCVKQSQVNNKTNLCAIAITDTNSITIGNFHSKTPLLPSIDSVDSILIRLRDINDVEYKINAPLFLNIKVLFAKK